MNGLAKWKTYGLPCLGLSMLLAACAPTPPRFGNDGGDAVPPASPASKQDTEANIPPPDTDWFPVQARFHPDGNRLVINFCHADAAYYCRMAQYDITRRDWRLLPNQEDGVSYFRPSYSNDGKTLVFGVSPCSPDRKQCNDGYGQLATMPAEGGPIRTLPVEFARRPHFTADDRRITYWRVKHQGKLASGRAIGAVSVYEYDLASGRETHLIESMESAPWNVHFVADLTAPRYTVDGGTLFFCGLTGYAAWKDPATGKNTEHPIPGWATNCIFYDRAKSEFKLVNTDRAGMHHKNIGDPYVDHQHRGLFTGSYLGFVDPRTLSSNGPRFFNTNREQLADADLNPQGRLAVAVTATMLYKDGQHIPKRRYFTLARKIPTNLGRRPTVSDEYYAREYPILALVNADSYQVTPLEWPDIQQMQLIGAH